MAILILLCTFCRRGAQVGGENELIDNFNVERRNCEDNFHYFYAVTIATTSSLTRVCPLLY